ncbi:hypothetical protein GCK72_014610 [Caenorhabditis remanei]|uniref:Uncharacterized protein n=2 Tax=Caenorhabditis remanei TaxID=31234 RepID=E3M607_CAERE|nr:hypothetical protein GCK72_014610 [Caenorhabditis remanei]EFO93228.1 hypothetical protein CRE_10071 [Caenorhabditis remanei]KAF1758152.1 hypothetical protein GCK72_014610 [Caenorhabditis remanei]
MGSYLKFLSFTINGINFVALLLLFVGCFVSTFGGGDLSFMGIISGYGFPTFSSLILEVLDEIFAKFHFRLPNVIAPTALVFVLGYASSPHVGFLLGVAAYCHQRHIKELVGNNNGTINLAMMVCGGCVATILAIHRDNLSKIALIVMSIELISCGLEFDKEEEEKKRAEELRRMRNN